MDGSDSNMIEFCEIDSRRDLAAYLGCQYKDLIYNLFVLPDDKRYKKIQIPKRNGDTRDILAPSSGIKRAQRMLATILSDLYKRKSCVHGYVKKHSILTNASVHKNKRIVINIDLKDFFPSINFGRVRGLFLNPPFSCCEEVATFIAQICCFDGVLPQGAPTSPIISNYICRSLDNELLKFARKYRLDYTRYADDITFSTNLREIPSRLGVIQENKLVLSEYFTSIIEENGFKINPSKVRYSYHTGHQEVTGLVVNKIVNVHRKYVKRIRAMIHAWEKYGLTATANEHFEKYNYKHRLPESPDYAFKLELQGMMGFLAAVKGKNNQVYARLYERLILLDKQTSLQPPLRITAPKDSVVIYGEGKTDVVHLAAAYRHFQQQGEFLGLKLHFHRWGNHDVNNEFVYNMCRTRSESKENDNLEIYIFDRDVARYVKDTTENGKGFKRWSDRVYSAVLPIPPHRNFNDICIEHFYSDQDLARRDKSGRRIYTSFDFNPQSGNLKDSNDIYYPYRQELKRTYPKIIDDKVMRISSGENIALSKNNFALYISRGIGEFADVDFENFRPIFKLIEDIVHNSRR